MLTLDGDNIALMDQLHLHISESGSAQSVETKLAGTQLFHRIFRSACISKWHKFGFLNHAFDLSGLVGTMRRVRFLHSDGLRKRW